MRILLLATLAVLFAPSAEAKRKIVLFGLGDTVGAVAPLDTEDLEGTDLPTDAEYGYYKDTFTLFFVPVFSWGGEPVIHSPSQETIWTLEGPDLAYFEEKYGVAADEYGGWSKWCNWVTGLIVLGFVVLKIRMARG